MHHNIFNYLYYLYYLEQKEYTEYNGIESYVNELVMKNDHGWMPIGKAIAVGELD
jgi:inositol 1,4,5-triphosphate receptor type 3